MILLQHHNTNHKFISGNLDYSRTSLLKTIEVVLKKT